MQGFLQIIFNISSFNKDNVKEHMKVALKRGLKNYFVTTKKRSNKKLLKARGNFILSL